MNAHDFFAHGLFLAEEFERVTIALAHLAAIKTGNDGRILADDGLGHDEGLAVGLVELDREIARHFKVLLLVATDRHALGVEEEDIGGHEDRIHKEADVGRDALGDLVFEAVGALEQPHGRERAEHPGKFADLGHVTLAPEDAFGGIEPAGEPIESDAEGIVTAELGVGERRHRVVVGDEIEALVVALGSDGRLHRAKVVAQMKDARRLNSGKSAHG